MTVETISPLVPFAKTAAKPLERAMTLQQEGGLVKEVGARLLHVVQIITSLIALPIILLIGLVNAVFFAIALDKDQSKINLQTMMKVLTDHLIVAIPTSVLGLFTTFDIAASAHSNALFPAAQKIGEVWDCTCCESDNDSQGSHFVNSYYNRNDPDFSQHHASQFRPDQPQPYQYRPDQHHALPPHSAHTLSGPTAAEGAPRIDQSEFDNRALFGASSASPFASMPRPAASPTDRYPLTHRAQAPGYSYPSNAPASIRGQRGAYSPAFSRPPQSLLPGDLYFTPSNDVALHNPAVDSDLSDDETPAYNHPPSHTPTGGFYATRREGADSSDEESALLTASVSSRRYPPRGPAAASALVAESRAHSPAFSLPSQQVPSAIPQGPRSHLQAYGNRAVIGSTPSVFAPQGPAAALRNVVQGLPPVLINAGNSGFFDVTPANLDARPVSINPIALGEAPGPQEEGLAPEQGSLLDQVHHAHHGLPQAPEGNEGQGPTIIVSSDPEIL